MRLGKDAEGASVVGAEDVMESSERFDDDLGGTIGRVRQRAPLWKVDIDLRQQGSDADAVVVLHFFGRAPQFFRPKKLFSVTCGSGRGYVW